MANQTSHFSDEELLLWVDGELPRHQAVKIRLHLSACWACRSRMAQIENSIQEFMRMNHPLSPGVPPGAGPRALLKARLAELSRSETNRTYPGERRMANAWMAASCLLALVLVGILLHTHTRQFRHQTPLTASPLPDPRLTPGATTSAGITDLCSAPHDEVVRSVSNALQETVLREYGLPPARSENFEIDFLVSPGLGGAESIRNLWPQPRYNTLWNSFVKDQLEDYLHRSVCGGRVSLKAAQRDIAGDWISAYQKYFHTKEPLTASLGLSVETPGNPTFHSRFEAPADLQAAPWGTAKSVALRGPDASQTNTELLSSHSSWPASSHGVIFTWNSGMPRSPDSGRDSREVNPI